jgi:CBS-domain-containing membrane protein
MKVEQIMNRTVSACHPEDSLNRAAQLMWDNGCGSLPVVDAHSTPIGFLTDRDICMAAYTRGKLLHELTVEGAMASSIICCRIEDELSAAMEVMRNKHVRRLPVIGRDGTLAGILALDDIAYEAGRSLRGGVNYRLRELVGEVFMAICHGRVSARPPHAKGS